MWVMTSKTKQAFNSSLSQSGWWLHPLLIYSLKKKTQQCMDKRLTLLYRYTENCHEPLNIQIRTSNLLQTKCKSSQIKSPGTIKVQSVRKHTVGEGKLCVCENFCVFSEQRKVMDSRPACDQDNWKQNKLLKSIQKQKYIYICI